MVRMKIDAGNKDSQGSVGLLFVSEWLALYSRLGRRLSLQPGAEGIPGVIAANNPGQRAGRLPMTKQVVCLDQSSVENGFVVTRTKFEALRLQKTGGILIKCLADIEFSF